MMTNKDYERLTFQNNRYGGMICGVGLKANSEEIAERLYVLEELIENGTLVFLPCKAGDKIWRLVDNWYETMIVEYTVEKIFVGKDCVLYIQDQMWHIPWTIDEVFFTKEAAEKALEEMKK